MAGRPTCFRRHQTPAIIRVANTAGCSPRSKASFGSTKRTSGGSRPMASDSAVLHRIVPGARAARLAHHDGAHARRQRNLDAATHRNPSGRQNLFHKESHHRQGPDLLRLPTSPNGATTIGRNGAIDPVNTKVSGWCPNRRLRSIALRLTRLQRVEFRLTSVQIMRRRQQRLPGNGLAALASPGIVKLSPYQPLTISHTLPIIVMAVHLAPPADRLN